MCSMDATPGQVDGTTESSGTSPSLVEREIMPDKSLQGGMTIDPPENLKRASAQELNIRGGEAFRQGHFDIAVQLYTAALKSPDFEVVGEHQLYCNRSAALLKAGDPHAAYADAKQACRISPKSMKAWGRAGASAFYSHEYILSCHAFRQQYMLEPNMQSRKNLVSSLCRAALQAGSGGVDPVKEANEALTQVISCLAISDRLVWMAASLQIGILAKQDCLKDTIHQVLIDSLLYYIRLSPGDLDLQLCPRGMLKTSECAVDLNLLYTKSIGAAHHETHQLAVIAFILANLAAGDNADPPFVSKILQSRASMDALYTLTGTTSFCYRTQHFISRVYRSMADYVLRRGSSELRLAMDGCIFEALEILIRNAMDLEWENEAAYLKNLLWKMKKHPDHPDNQVCQN